MSLPILPQVIQLVGFPRVSGDEPRSDHTDPGSSLFSPRERG